MTKHSQILLETYPGADVFKFGDSAELSGRLVGLIRQGTKTASCGSLDEFTAEPGAMPVVGRCDIATDWDGTPALVIRTTRVETIRYCDVSEAMALAEGENDDLVGWRRDHQAYFERNGGFSPDMMLVFEHFELVEDLAGSPP